MVLQAFSGKHRGRYSTRFERCRYWFLVSQSCCGGRTAITLISLDSTPRRRSASVWAQTRRPGLLTRTCSVIRFRPRSAQALLSLRTKTSRKPPHGGFLSSLLRGPESNRRLEVLLHLLFPAGMDYPMIPKDPPIIVSEPSESYKYVLAWLLIAESSCFSGLRAHPLGSRCGTRSSHGVPAS